MLEHELRRASRQSSTRALTVGAAILGLVCVSAVAVIWLSQPPAPPDEISGEDSSVRVVEPNPVAEPGAPTPLAEVSEPPADIPRPSPLPTAPEAEEGIAPLPEPLAEAASTNDPEVGKGPPPKTQTASRQDVIDALANFSEKIRPQINTEGFSNFAPDVLRQVTALETDALSAFNSGSFDEALGTITEATDRAEQTLEAQEVAFDKALQDAKKFFAEDDFENSDASIQEALTIYPDDLGAQELAERISKLPEILGHLQAAQTARVENNLDAERDALKQALAIDPEREDAKQRLAQVSKSIREAAFARAIETGLQAINEAKIKEAKAALKTAQKLGPKKDETQLLAERIATVERSINVGLQFTEAHLAMRQDNWPQAVVAFQNAVKLDPTNVEALKGLAGAQAVLAALLTARVHLENADRLSATNVREEVLAFIATQSELAPNSPSLSASLAALTQKLDAYEREQPVRIESDGRTFIRVRGVGQIGLTEGRFVNLKPGRYTFEGRCEGYKTKLVPFDLEPGDAAATVTVVCDERI